MWRAIIEVPNEKIMVRFLTIMGMNKTFVHGNVSASKLSNKDITSILCKRIEDNIGFYFPETAEGGIKIVGKSWGGTGTGRTFKFKILLADNKKNHDIFVKISPIYEKLNPGTSEYEALKLLYPQMSLATKCCHVPRPLDFFYDLNALVTESVGSKSFKGYLLKNNSKKCAHKSTSNLYSMVIGCAHWLSAFHEITKSGMFVKFESSQFMETFKKEFELLRKLGLIKSVIDRIEILLGRLPLLDGRFLMPCAMWHYDFTPGHVFIEDNKITVIDVLGLPNAPIYEDIGKWLSAMPTVNSFPLYPHFDYEHANGRLGDVFLDGYLSRTTLNKNEFLILSNIYKLKYFISTFVAQTSRISERVHPIASKIFVRLRLRKIFLSNMLRTIGCISERMKLFA